MLQRIFFRNDGDVELIFFFSDIKHLEVPALHRAFKNSNLRL